MRVNLKFSASILGLLLSISALAQSPWVRTYGGVNEEKGNDLILTPDSGFLVVGYSGSMGQGASDMYIIKTDSLGIAQWQKSIGTANVDMAEAIVEGNLPGEYFIAGSSNGFFPYEYDFYYAKILSNGDTIKTGFSGTEEWDLCHAAVATGDGYLLVGETFYQGGGSTNGYLLKLNENLDTLKSYVLKSSDYTVFTDIVQYGPDRFLISGHATRKYVDSSDAMVWIVNGNGDFLDSLRFDYGKNEKLNCIAVSHGNGIMLGGYFHYDSTNFSKSLQIKLDDSASVELWHLMAPEWDDYGLEINDYAHFGNDVFIMAGESRYKYNDDFQAVVIRSYPDGLPFFNKESGIIFPIDGFFGICASHDKGLVAVGYTQSYGPGIQALLLSKFGEFGATATSVSVDLEKEKETKWKIYPNPAGDFLYLEVARKSDYMIVDMAGRTMQTGSFQGEGLYQISLSMLGKGSYFIVLHADQMPPAYFPFIKH